MAVYTLWGQGAVSSASNSYNGSLGTVLSQDGSAGALAVAAVWYYSTPLATALPSACYVYLSSSGAAVVSQTAPQWSGAAGSGWVRCPAAGAVLLTAGVSYVAAVDTTGQDADPPYTWPVTSGPITGTQAVYGTAGTMPSGAAGPYRYCIDVELATVSGSGLLMAAGII